MSTFLGIDWDPGNSPLWQNFNINPAYSDVFQNIVAPISLFGQSAILTYGGEAVGAYYGGAVGAAAGGAAGAWASNWLGNAEMGVLGAKVNQADQWAMFVGSAVGAITYAAAPTLLSGASASSSVVSTSPTTWYMTDEGYYAPVIQFTEPTVDLAATKAADMATWTDVALKYGKDLQGIGAAVAGQYQTIAAISSPLLPKDSTTSPAGGSLANAKQPAKPSLQASTGLIAIAFLLAAKKFL